MQKKLSTTMKLNPLKIEDVRSCKLCAGLGTDHVPSEGEPLADLMIVSDSPGFNEVRKGRPFVGAIGEMINYMLDEAEIPRTDVYLTYTLKCKPPGNRMALTGELSNCWKQWLYGEIRAVSPLLILLLGGDTHSSIIPAKFPFGHLVVARKKNLTFLSSYAPGYFMRRGKTEEFVNVGNKVKEMLEELRQDV